MTNEMMNLQALLSKSADADFLREMIGFAAGRLMKLEVEAKGRETKQRGDSTSSGLKRRRQ